MGHVIAFGVELPCPVHGFLQDAQKLWSDLFPARHGRFDGGSCKFSGNPLKLMQDFGCFHWRFVRAEFSFHSPTVAAVVAPAVSLSWRCCAAAFLFFLAVSPIASYRSMPS